MAAPTVIQASLATILPLVKAQLVSKTGLTAPRVKIVARDTDKIPLYDDSDILIRPLGFTVLAPTTDGSGRYATVISRELQLTIRTRLALDEPESDEAWLDDPALGHCILEENALDALQNFAPTDINNNWLVVEPLDIQPTPKNDKQPSSDSGWGTSVLMFSLTYMPPLPSGPTI